MRAGKRTDDREPFAVAELPKEFPGPNCMLFPEQVRRFRDDFRMLMEFAAEVCSVKPEELCPLHLLMWKMMMSRAQSLRPQKIDESQPPQTDAPIEIPGPEAARNSDGS